MVKQLDDVVTIRLAKPQDRSTIVKIQLEALKVLAAKDYTPKQLSVILKNKSKPRKSYEIIFIAEIARQPVGFASLVYPFNTIGAVFVDPKFCRLGIGTKLLQRLEEEAIKYQVTLLWVNSSLNGRTFYRANGYSSVRKIIFSLYSTYIPCVQMKKRLLPVNNKEIVKEVYQLVAVVAIATLLGAFFLK